jgi:hypothetical protein
MADRAPEVEDRINVQGVKYFNEQALQTETRLASGELVIVTLTHIKQCLFLAESRLQCSDYDVTADIPRLVELLSELREYDLAIELAISSKHTVGYPILAMLNEYQSSELPKAEGPPPSNNEGLPTRIWIEVR